MGFSFVPGAIGGAASDRRCSRSSETHVAGGVDDAPRTLGIPFFTLAVGLTARTGRLGGRRPTTTPTGVPAGPAKNQEPGSKWALKPWLRIGRGLLCRR